MDKEMDKRLKAIEKKLDALLKQTDPKRVERELKHIGVSQFLESGPRKGYAGVPADDPRMRGMP